MTNRPIDSLVQERLAQRVRGLVERGHARVQAAAPLADDGGPAPLSHMQEAIWLHCRIDDQASSLYNLAICMRVRGQGDPGQLHAVLQAVVQRHEILRTSIASEQGRAWLHPHDSVPFELDIADFSDMELEAAVGAMHALARTTAAQPFDLARPPLFRFKLCILSPGEVAVVIVAHHIIFDGWSYGQFMQDLLVAYRAAHGGATPTLPPLPLQFSQYARRQRSQESHADYQASLRYWRDALQGYTPAPVLMPASRLSDSVSFPCVRSASWLGEIEFRALFNTARALRVSSFAVFTACLAICLHRLGGQDDIGILTPMSSRDSEETAQLIGPLIAFVLLRVRMTPGQSFEALAHEVHKRALQGLANQNVSLDKVLQLVGETAGRRDPSRFVALHWDDTPTPDSFAASNLVCYRQAVPNERSAYPLSVFVQANLVRDRALLTLEYAPDFFSPGTIENLEALIHSTLKTVTQDPRSPCNRLALLPDVDRLRVLKDWNATEKALAGSPVHELVLAQALQRPQALAVASQEAALDYDELATQARRLAALLSARGFRHQEVIGVCLDRTARIPVALLAVMLAGGVYLPLDASLPAARMRHMIEDAQVRGVLVDASSASNLCFGSLQRINLDTVLGEPAMPSEFALPTVMPDDLAYVMYTSGSTGKPKGVMISHAALANVVQDFGQRLSLGPGRSMLVSTSLSFDISGLELFAPLVSGAAVHVVASDVIEMRRACARLIEQGGTAPVMQATPTVWAALWGTGWRPQAGQTLLCGGERMPQTLAMRLHQTGADVVNVYGPTETTIWSTSAAYRADESIRIGRPIANTSVYVLDARMQALPVGAAGELFIGGAGLARGYWNNASLTAERFFPSPFEAGARIYRTGDRARWTSDGQLEFLGRVDDQIKLRGHRIELGEIEAAACQSSGVGAAVALVVEEDDPDAAHLALHVVASPGSTVDIAALWTQLRAELPRHMLPGRVNLLDKLPLTSSGKVDRNALASLTGGEVRVRRVPYVKPGTATERALALMWAEMISIPFDEIGRDDDFFELGGNSLIAMRVVSRMHDEFKTGLPLEALFLDSSLAKLAAQMDLKIWLLSGASVKPDLANQTDSSDRVMGSI